MIGAVGRAVPGGNCVVKMRFVIIFLFSLIVASTTSRDVSAQSKSSGARFALVIGNAKYPDSDGPLKDAINDARELAKELKRDGFDVERHRVVARADQEMSSEISHHSHRFL